LVNKRETGVKGRNEKIKIKTKTKRYVKWKK
jgi:hypothetical protein